MRHVALLPLLGLVLLFHLNPRLVMGSDREEIATALRIVGVAVTEHQVSSEMRWRREPDPTLSARVELFVQNPNTESDRKSVV